MYEIVLDTETTGFDPAEGHRLVEIGCIELHNHVPTGRTYHQYINPERDVPAEAVAVHGITNEFLKDKPVMAEIASDFMEFIAETQLVIHNAEFDMKFLNAELKKLGYRPLKNPVVDTVIMARQMFPGQPASLDALCRRFKIDNTGRTFHGALLDSQLLADVYLELKGGRQQGLGLGDFGGGATGDLDLSSHSANGTSAAARPYRSFDIPENEKAAHDKMVAALGDAAVWKKITSQQ